MASKSLSLLINWPRFTPCFYFNFFSNSRLNSRTLCRIILSYLIIDLNISPLSRTCCLLVPMSLLKLIMILVKISLFFCIESLLFRFIKFKFILSLDSIRSSWMILSSIFLNYIICATNRDRIFI